MMSRLSTLAGALVSCLLGTACVAGELTSEDATIHWNDGLIELQTAVVAHRFQIADGKLIRVAWIDRKSGGRDLLQNGPIADFQLQVNGGVLSSPDPGWRIAEPACEKLAHGELRLKLELTRNDLRVVRYYVVYPRISLVRGWLEIAALGKDRRFSTIHHWPPLR